MPSSASASAGSPPLPACPLSRRRSKSTRRSLRRSARRRVGVSTCPWRTARRAPADSGDQRLARRDEIENGAEVDVGRVVPAMRQHWRHRHAAMREEVQADAPMAEIRERNDGAPADADEMLEHLARLMRRLQRLAEHGVVEGVRRIILEIVVRVALDDREAVPHAGVDARLRQLHAAAVDALVLRQIGEQLAVTAADIEHARARLDHLRDEPEIAAQARAVGGGAGDAAVGAHSPLRPRWRAQPSRKPRKVAKNSGSSSRNASWPLSVSISTKLTLAATALSAWTMARFSAVG